jgi:hypothetical protein
MHYDALYVSFDRHRTASIQPLFTDLVTYTLIAIDKDETVTITDAGPQTLAGSGIACLNMLTFSGTPLY